MNAKKIMEGAEKLLSNEQIKDFGRQCISIGVSLGKKQSYNKMKRAVGPIMSECIRSQDPNIKSIGGKLLHSFKKMK